MGEQYMGELKRIVERRLQKRARVIEEARSWARSLAGPVAVALVGSYARGDFNEWSDVDVVIISPLFEGLKPLERLRRLEAPPGYELIPLTPGELKRLVEKRNPLAVDLVCNGIVLRDDTRLLQETVEAGRARLCMHEARGWHSRA